MMVLKKGNKKPFKNKEELFRKLEIYFNEYLPENKEIADVESLCVFLGISRRELKALERSKQYGQGIAVAKTRIASVKKQLAMCGRIPATVFSFDFRNNHEYNDKGDEQAELAKIVIEGKAKEWSV